MDAFGERLSWLRTLVASESALGSESSGSDLRTVAWITGLCGWILGSASGYQVAVESAQVVAGVVEYPLDNPFYMYHVKTWTLLHQVPALWLRLGMSEQMASLIIGGLVGLLSFQAIGLCCLAISGQRWLAVMAPILCLATNACKETGGVYPLRILSDSPWIVYGATGTAYCVFVLCLLSFRVRRLGALLAGMALAVHPALGAWCVGIAGLTLAWNWKSERAAARTYALYFAAGLLVTATSFAVQAFLARSVPDVPAAVQQQYVTAFAENWDSHRKAFPTDSPVLWYGFGTLVLGLIWLRLFADQLSSEGIYLLRMLVISALLGLLLCIMTQLQSYLPQAVVAAMPGRFINVVGLAFPSVVLGLLARHRRVLLIEGLLCGLLVFSALRVGTLDMELYYVPPAPRVLLAAALILLYLTSRLFVDRPSREDATPMLLLVECASLAGLIAVAAWWASGDFKLAVLLWLLVALTPLLAGRDLPDYAWLRPLLWGLEFTALAIIVVVKLDPWVVLGIASALGCVALWRNRGHVMDHALAPRYRTGLAAALGTLAVIAIGTPWLMRCASAYDEMEDWRNEPVFAAVARGKGLLLTEPRLRATQLRTRRPVLLEATALNQIPYVPASAPAINRILQAIYDEDILGPRMPEWRHNPTLPVPEAKRLWKARSQREWLALAREFGFTDVLTRDDWKLRLPVVAKSGSMTLYHVPGAERPITDKVASRTAD